jgi:hypothetical protein
MCLCICLATVAVASEKKIKRTDLPAAVEKTVAEQSKDATVKGFSQEIEKGKKYYEAELVVAGHTKDVLIDESGKVTEVEEEVALDTLPAAVKDALTKRAGKGTLGKVESLTKGGKLVAYEAVVKTGAKHSEIQVGPNGEKLKHAE